jgi:hypothetical protein
MAISSRLSMQRNFHGTFHFAGAAGLVIPSGTAYSPNARGLVIAEWRPVPNGLA